MEPYQVQRIRVRVDLGVMAINEYATFRISLELKPQDVVLCITQDTPFLGTVFCPSAGNTVSIF